MMFFIILLALAAATAAFWKHDDNSNWTCAGMVVTGIYAFMLLFMFIGIRTESDTRVSRHPELQALAKALPEIHKASPVEYAKLVQEIGVINKDIDDAKENNCSVWFDWFINDKLVTLPKIEIR